MEYPRSGRRGRVADLIGRRRIYYCTYLFLPSTPPRRASPTLNELPSWPIRGSGTLGRTMSLKQHTSSLCWPAVCGSAANRRAVRVSERWSANADWRSAQLPNPSGVQERRCSAGSADGSRPSAVPSRVRGYFARRGGKPLVVPHPTPTRGGPPPPSEIHHPRGRSPLATSRTLALFPLEHPDCRRREFRLPMTSHSFL